MTCNTIISYLVLFNILDYIYVSLCCLRSICSSLIYQITRIRQIQIFQNWSNVFTKTYLTDIKPVKILFFQLSLPCIQLDFDMRHNFTRIAYFLGARFLIHLSFDLSNLRYDKSINNNMAQQSFFQHNLVFYFATRRFV